MQVVGAGTGTVGEIPEGGEWANRPVRVPSQGSSDGSPGTHDQPWAPPSSAIGSRVRRGLLRVQVLQGAQLVTGVFRQAVQFPRVEACVVVGQSAQHLPHGGLARHPRTQRLQLHQATTVCCVPLTPAYRAAPASMPYLLV
jgi:hypothetical protein